MRTALKIIIMAESVRFRLVEHGPNVLAIERVNLKVEQIEQSFQEANR